MSRYEVEAIDVTHCTVIVGWDNPLRTFFAQVWDLAKVETDDDESCVVWVGTHPGSVPSVAALTRAISAYAVLPADTLARLEQDRAASEPPTPLQQWVVSRFIRPVDASSQL